MSIFGQIRLSVLSLCTAASICWPITSQAKQPLSIVVSSPSSDFKIGGPITISAIVENNDVRAKSFNDFWAPGSFSVTLIAHVYTQNMVELPLTDLGTGLYHPSDSIAVPVEGTVTAIQPKKALTSQIELDKIFVFSKPGMYYVRVDYGKGSSQHASSKLVHFWVGDQ